eukprot:TRINITY_DN65037_c0_g1_i1.p1 TRINITY_DN65037_c0_g1~~TRINITY_DN65037_c0_g1_i1.p1  ORF type:complete len:415 (+),score=118.59 TRINITY_DN65037_c0_g1_i1:48-1292(+)
MGHCRRRRSRALGNAEGLSVAMMEPVQHRVQHPQQVPCADDVAAETPPAEAEASLERSVHEHAVPVRKGGALELLWGAGGIYACFLYYGSLQEDVFRWRSDQGSQFTQVWFLQLVEALANVVVGLAGLCALHGGLSHGLPQQRFALTGCTQVCAKYFTNAALAQRLSFPVATLAKSGKMVPVMAGSLIIGGATYTVREYLQVLAIVIGTCIVGLSQKKKSGAEESSALGLVFIVFSLVCDGLTGGTQKRLKAECASRGVVPTPYDFMFCTNFYMAIVALCLSVAMGELLPGCNVLFAQPELRWLVLKFALLSAIGQSFIFYTIATFDPLVCTTVTTTRKVFSVLYSLLFKGHSLPALGWLGVLMASLGILGEISDKSGGEKKPPAAAPATPSSQPRGQLTPSMLPKEPQRVDAI